MDGKIDDLGFTIEGWKDVTDVVSVFRTRKTARKLFQDVRPVYIIPAVGKAKK